MARQVTPEELLAHARWMRPLARSLVGDADAAEDVVQASMAAALARRPDAGRPLGPWLARVVRNLSATFRRDEGRRAERETRHAESRAANEPGEDPAASLERLDTQQLLIDLVRELEPAQRETIVLAFFEGLSSVEIARRLSIPDATVRWRKQQALEALRAKLGTRFGSREAWCALLAPLALPLSVPLPVPLPSSPAVPGPLSPVVTSPSSAATAGTTAAGAAAGAIAMGSALKLALAAAALALVGAGVWWSQGEHGSTTVAARAPEASLPNAPTSVVAPTEMGSAEPASRAPMAVPPSPLAESAPGGVPTETSAFCTVRARFVDSTGRPWSDVAFEIEERSRFCLIDPTRGSTTGDADGRVELQFGIKEQLAEVNLGITASRRGCAPQTLRVTPLRGGAVDLGQIVLERESRVLGSVHDTAGAGLSTVTVGIARADFASEEVGQLRRHGPAPEERTLVTSTDPRGDFELGGVSPGRWCLWGHREGLGYGVSKPFEIGAGAEIRGIVFEVPPLAATDTIAGIVLGAAGEPEANAWVTFVWESRSGSGSTSCFTGADGKFELLLNHEASGDVFAQDMARTQRSTTLRNVVPGARDLVLRLGDPDARMPARLYVHGPDREPVRGIRRIIVFEQQVHGGHTGAPVDTKELEPGHYEFRLPGAPFWLQVEADGYVTGKLPDGQGTDLEPDRVATELELSLAVAPKLRGRVTAATLAVGQASIEALDAVRPGYWMTANEFPSLMKPWSEVSGTSAADGTFTLNLQGTKPIYLRCVAAGFAPAIVGPLSPAAPGALDVPVAIELVVGGTIEGRAHTRDGTPVAGVIIGITCGDGHPRTMLSGLDGAYRFDNLTPGPWLVIERDEVLDEGLTTSSGKGERPIVWTCSVTSGATTRFDLTLAR